MRKIIVVAVREYQAAVKTKAFLIMLIAMPVLMGGGILAQTVLSKRVDIQTKRIAVIDHDGRVYQGIAKAAESRNARIFDENGKQEKPKYTFELIVDSGENTDEAAFQFLLLSRLSDDAT